MPESVAALIVAVLVAYLGAGLVFAVGFAWRWAGRLDPAAEAGTRGFRVLIVPGAIFLWPYLTARILRAIRALERS